MTTLTAALNAVLFSVAVGSSAFGQTTHTYRVEWYPLADAACRAEAAAIGTRFEAATGYQVVATGCERPFSWKQDLVIQYAAQAEARLVTTFAEFATAGQGLYQSKSSCEAALANEKSLFEDETGLAAVTAFCYPETQDSSQNGFPFVARIDGFGVPERRPYVFSANFQYAPNVTRQVAEAAIADAVASITSLQSARVKVDLVGAQPRVTIKYYDTRRRALILNSEVSFASLQDCEDQKAETDSRIEEFGIDGLRSFCARKTFSQSAAHIYFGLVSGAFRVERVPGSYGSRSECQAAAPAIAQRYAVANGVSKVQPFCTFDRQDVVANEAYYVKLLLAL